MHFKPLWIGDTSAPYVRFWCTDLCDSEVCLGDPKTCAILEEARQRGVLIGGRIRVFYPEEEKQSVYLVVCSNY